MERKTKICSAKKKLCNICFSGHELFIWYVVVAIDLLILWSCMQFCIHYFTCSELEQVTKVKTFFSLLKQNSLWDKAVHNSIWCITSHWYLTTLTPWWCNSFLIIWSQSIKGQLQIMHPGKWWRMSRTVHVERLSKHNSKKLCYWFFNHFRQRLLYGFSTGLNITRSRWKWISSLLLHTS